MLLIRSLARNQSNIYLYISLLEPDRTGSTCHVYKRTSAVSRLSGNTTGSNLFLLSELGRICTTRRRVRSRVELNLEALACHPRTKEEYIRAPWNVCFYFFLLFFAFFRLVFFIPFKVVLPYKHYISRAQTLYILKTPS